MMPGLDLAARLRDVHPPADPAWWPPAPGWWLVALAAALLAALALRALLPHGRRWRTRRRLLGALEAVARRHRAGAPAHATAAEVSRLLRHAVLERFPDRGAAGLHGGDWIAFLESCDRAPGRFERLRAALTAAPYAASGALDDAAPLLAAARGWLRAAL